MATFAGTPARRMFTDTVLVSGLGAAVKVAGAAKVIVMARVFGAGDAVDAFLIAFLIPALLGETLSGPLSAALVPGFVEARESGDRADAERIYQGIIGRVLVLMTAAAVVLAVGAPYLLPVLAGGFPPAKLDLTRNLLYCLLPVLPLSAFSAGWRARLVADQRFLPAALAPGAIPLATMGTILIFGSSWGAYALAAGTAAGCVLEETFLAASLMRNGSAILPRFDRATPALRRVTGQYLPVMVTALVAGSATLIDQSFASRQGAGGVATLNYGTRLVLVFLSIAVTGVNTAALPRLSQMAAQADWTRLASTLKRAAMLALAAALPLTLGLMMGSGLLVRMFFASSRFTDASFSTVNDVQVASFLRIPFSLMMALLAGLLASLRANHLLLFATVAGVAVNAGLDLLLVKSHGVAGISLAGSLAQIVTFATAAILLHRWLRAERSTW